MNRLQSELQRLYFRHEGTGEDAGSEASRLLAPGGLTRALVLEVAAPAGWEVLSRAWHGVQADLHLPAPGIAIDGSDAYQLWLSLAEPIAAERAASFLRSLQARYLGDVRPDRVRIYPSDGSAHASHVGRVPPALAAPEHWSAFLAPDLAALFADERWLDMAPSPEAQGELLSRLQTTKVDDLQRAIANLASAADAAAPGLPAMPRAGGQQGPREFLLAVMNDPAIDLKLRIEAAKALLPASDRP